MIKLLACALLLTIVVNAGDTTTTSGAIITNLRLHLPKDTLIDAAEGTKDPKKDLRILLLRGGSSSKDAASTPEAVKATNLMYSGSNGNQYFSNGNSNLGYLGAGESGNNVYNGGENGINGYNGGEGGNNVYNGGESGINGYNGGEGGNNVYNGGESGYNSGESGINGYNGGEGGNNVYNGGASGINGYNGGEGGNNVYIGGESGINGYNGGEGGHNVYNGGESGINGYNGGESFYNGKPTKAGQYNPNPQPARPEYVAYTPITWTSTEADFPVARTEEQILFEELIYYSFLNIKYLIANYNKNYDRNDNYSYERFGEKCYSFYGPRSIPDTKYYHGESGEANNYGGESSGNSNIDYQPEGSNVYQKQVLNPAYLSGAY